ncbi:hypothetical protein A6770_08690 [Nostoc minutum NIES-26]|uniref:Restriction endonuclease type IV Mrr domain-containing protein n=1 Tax=Nostoc minutum NIES-26 TaxID=1844469 RepID=A0A367S0J3_9NOSO|nr:hypothetical protein A6770_08690 [Nostoc minutum NIES-26]
MPSQKELVQSVIDALVLLNRDDPESDKLASYLYNADPRLSEYLEKLKQFTQLKNPTLSESKKAGELLEQIVCLVFRGLQGATSFKSFQSAGPQYDFIVSGDQLAWLHVCNLLYLKENQRSIVVEAKATQSPLPDKQFARLCSIMELNLSSTVGLGVFFTLNGATGFPQQSDSRQRAIRDCRLRQVIFHAKTQKIIVVLDKDDIFEFSKNGSLIQILVRKIRDLEELSGLPTPSVEQREEVDLPDHLKQL